MVRKWGDFRLEKQTMAQAEHSHVTSVRQFIQAIEQGAEPAKIAAFLHPDVRQVEYPNRLFAQGAERDLAAMQQAGESGKRVVREQRYEIRNVLVSDDHVAVEIVWTATLNVTVGALEPGSQIRAYIGQFFDFRDGKI